MKPGPLHWERGVSAIGPPGKSLEVVLKHGHSNDKSWGLRKVAVAERHEMLVKGRVLKMITVLQVTWYVTRYVTWTSAPPV